MTNDDGDGDDDDNYDDDSKSDAGPGYSSGFGWLTNDDDCCDDGKLLALIF